MGETFRSFLLLSVSLIISGDVHRSSADNSYLSKNYMDCLVSAGKLHAELQPFVCNGSISDLWEKRYEKCANMCTLHIENTSCGENNKVLARFHFDINLPINVYAFEYNCSTCFNVTQVNITCNLNLTNEKTQPCLNKEEDVSTAETVSISSDTQVVTTIAAAVSGVVFGAVITIGVWIIKQKLSKDKLWQRRSTVQNPTYNASPRSSDPEPEPDISMDNQYTEINPKNKRSYTRKEDSDPYNHLHETTNNMEDISSPYDHAPYLPQDGRKQNETIQDSGYMHIDINKLGMN